VNLIGEHTDYNDGFVLPMAIDRRVFVAMAPRPDDDIVVEADHDGGRYVRAVVELLRRTHRVPGIDVLVRGDVPVGAGLASSAALELAAARAIAELAGIPWDALAMARLAQRAENDIVGVQCGIMDQVAAACGRRGCAMLIDCRTLAIEHVELHEEVAIVVMDSGSRRKLVGSEYNIRRQSCERAALDLRVPALRDATVEMLRAVRAQPPRRCAPATWFARAG
jgi:galactokinase